MSVNDELTFEDAMCLLRINSKIRRPEWDEEDYWHLKNGKIYRYLSMSNSFIEVNDISTAIILNTTWELFPDD